MQVSESPPVSTLLAQAALLAAGEVARRVATKAAHPDTRRLLLAHMDAARKLYRQHSSGQASKVTLDGLPRPLARLIQSLVDAMGEWGDKLVAADMTLREWAETMRDAIIEYHLAGFMSGAGSDVVSDKGLDEVAEQVSVQLDYLNGFKVELQGQDEYAAGAKARAESYAPAIKVPYWTGATRVLPLPAMPAQGTTCQNNCKCKWRVVTLDESAGNYDAYWERHAEDSCQVCVEREAQWSPVRIRDGVLEKCLKSLTVFIINTTLSGMTIKLCSKCQTRLGNRNKGTLCGECRVKYSVCQCGASKDYRAIECISCGRSRKAKEQWKSQRSSILAGIRKAAPKRWILFEDLTDDSSWQQRYDGRHYIYYRTKNGKRRTIYRHQWRWITTHGPVPKGMVVHHKNEIKSDGSISNLELMTDTKHRQHHMTPARIASMVAARKK